MEIEVEENVGRAFEDFRKKLEEKQLNLYSSTNEFSIQFDKKVEVLMCWNHFWLKNVRMFENLVF
jgi:hypothetical protein